MAGPGALSSLRLLPLCFRSFLPHHVPTPHPSLMLPFLALTAAHRLFPPSSPLTSLASASAAHSTTSSMSGISTHCPTSCGPRQRAGSHTYSGMGWAFPGSGLGYRAPRPKTGTGQEKNKSVISFPGYWCWGSLSSPGIHTHPRPAARPPYTHATPSSCCSSGWAPSLQSGAVSRARKPTETLSFTLASFQDPEGPVNC